MDAQPCPTCKRPTVASPRAGRRRCLSCVFEFDPAAFAIAFTTDPSAFDQSQVSDFSVDLIDEARAHLVESLEIDEPGDDETAREAAETVRNAIRKRRRLGSA